MGLVESGDVNWTFGVEAFHHQFDVEMLVGVRENLATSELKVAHSNCRQHLVVEEMFAYILYTKQHDVLQ